MSSYLAFAQDARRRTIRATPNPYDKATIVSIFPKGFTETKPTIQPGVFTIEAGSLAKPSILVVGPSSWWKEVDEGQPLLEIPTSAVQIADSVVRDYCVGLLGCNMTDMMPGLFYLPGEVSLPEIKERHSNMLLKYNQLQRNWYAELVKIADILWSRSNGNPLTISDDARLACRELNISDKPWQKDTYTMSLVRCVACGSLRNPEFPICQTCKAVVDPAKAKELNLTFAQ